MRNLNGHPVKRAAVGVLAGTLALSGGALAAGVSPANAVEGFAFEDRLAGNDRYETAAEIATDTFATADTVVLARGDVFADALTGNYLAGVRNAPILLTRTGDVPQATADALVALGVDTVLIVGGTSAVSQAVEDDLNDDYLVERFEGTDRFKTAQAVANEGAAADSDIGEVDGLRTAILGNGLNFPDVLAAGPLGFAELFPITLTFPTDLPAETASVFADLEIEQVIIVGGTAAVSAAVATEVDGLVDTVRRIDGTGDPDNAVFDRFATARDIADFAYDELDFDDTQVNLARGDDFADALAGGPHAGTDPAPIVLTFPNTLPVQTTALLTDRCPTLADGHIFGGTAAVSPATETAAETAASSCAGGINPNETLNVQPETPLTLSPVVPNDDDGDASTADNRSFTVTGLDDDETYRITLVACDNITRDGDGNAVFAFDPADVEGDGDNLAATGPTQADIITINGTATTDADAGAGVMTRTATGTPVNGSLTFTIDGDGAECVVPVVYLDGGAGQTNAQGGSSIRLELDDDGLPVETFGLGGETTFLPAEAPNGTNVNGEVVLVDEDANFFVVDNGGTELLFRYDSNDQFSYDPSSGSSFFITFADFEDYLSVGDVIVQTDVTAYSTNPAVANEFEISEDELNAPTGVQAVVGDADTVVDDPATPDVNEATAANDVTVTFTAADEGLVNFSTAFVYEDDGDATTPCADGVVVVTEDSNAPAVVADQEVVFENLPDGDYCVVVTATSETGATSEVSDAATFTVAAVQSDPAIITSAVLTTDAVTVDEADSGDVYTLVFDEALDPATLPNAQIALTDADGDTVLVECNSPDALAAAVTDATCVLSAGTNAVVDNDTLVVTLTADAIDRNAAGDDIILYPLTITAVTGLEDLGGETISVATSTDVTIS